MDVYSTLRDISQTFDNLGRKYPFTRVHLKRCLESIKGEVVKYETEEMKEEEKRRKREKKESLNVELRGSIKEIESVEQTLPQSCALNVQGNNPETFVKAIDGISKHIKSSKMISLWLHLKQGEVLRKARDNLQEDRFDEVIKRCDISKSHASFLVSLFDLTKDFPRLKFCCVTLRTFSGNIKVIRELCESDVKFWCVDSAFDEPSQQVSNIEVPEATDTSGEENLNDERERF